MFFNLCIPQGIVETLRAVEQAAARTYWFLPIEQGFADSVDGMFQVQSSIQVREMYSETSSQCYPILG
jgi:hypothetical protein